MKNLFLFVILIGLFNGCAGGLFSGGGNSSMNKSPSGTGHGGAGNFGNYDKTIWYVGHVIQVDSIFTPPDSGFYGITYQGLFVENYHHAAFQMMIRLSSEEPSIKYIVTVDKFTGRVSSVYRDI